MSSTYTPNLALEKPDVNDFYDIAVANGNMDAIDSEVVKKLDISSIEFSSDPSDTYPSKGVCSHNGKLYQNTSGTFVSGGTWIPAYWTEVKLGNVATLNYSVVGTY